MDRDDLLARCQLLMAGNDAAALAEALPGLEAIKPVTEAEWRTLHAIFAKLGRVAWLEIATVRFLETEPGNVAARLEQAKIASEAPTRREEAVERLKALDALPIAASQDLLTRGLIHANCGQVLPASQWLRKASDADPFNVGIRVRIFFALLGLGEHEMAKAEILRLRDIAGGQLDRLQAVVTLALRLKLTAVANEALDAAIALMPPGDHNGRTVLIIQAAQLGRAEHLAQLVTATSFAHVRSVELLQDAYAAIEGRGFYGPERQIVAAALALAPEHQRFGDLARRLAQPVATLFPSADAGATPLHAGRRVMDRIRELMFWR